MLRCKMYMILFNILGIFVQRYIVYVPYGILIDRFTGEAFYWN